MKKKGKKLFTALLVGALGYLAANLGLVASPTIAGLLFKNYLWLSFIISGVAIACSTVLIFFFVKDITPVDVSEDESGAYQMAKDDASMMSILRENKVMVLYILIMAFYWGAYNQWGYLLPLDMARVHGDDGALIFGSINSINCIVVVIFTPILTKIFSRFHGTVKNLISILFLLGGFVIFLIGLGMVPVYYVAITLFTWGEILATIVMGPYMTERIPASHRGRINAFVTVIQTVIMNAAMLIVGVLYDNVSGTVAWFFVFGILIVALLGSVALISLDKKYYSELYR